MKFCYRADFETNHIEIFDLCLIASPRPAFEKQYDG